MAYSTVPKAKKDGKITFQDGTGSPVTLEVAYEEGNFSFETPVRDEIVVRDRGTISTVRQGDEQPITGSFNFYMRSFTDASNAGSIQDFITGTGSYNANVSTGTAGSPYVEHYSIDMEYEVEGTALGDDTDTAATFSKCVCVLSFAEGDPSAFTLNFTCYGGVTYSSPT
jgi:hypothetical protein